MIEGGKERLDRVKGEAVKYFKCEFIHAPHYTPHGAKHSESIETLLDRFLSTYPEIDLNDYEEFLLKCAIYLHDIGMFIRKSRDESLEEIRDAHHQRSADEIRAEKEVFGLSDFEANVVATISILHRKSEDISQTADMMSGDGILQKEYSGTTYEVDLKKLALLLRLLDGCDRVGRGYDYREVLEKAKMPKAAMYHYVHNCVDSIEFTKDSITLHTLVLPPKEGEEKSLEEKMVEVLVTYEIDGELDSIRSIMRERGWENLLRLRAKQEAVRSKEGEVPKEIEEQYTSYSELMSFHPTPNYEIRRSEKSICIRKNGHAIVDVVKEIIVTEEEGISSIRYMFGSDESSTPEFNFPSLEIMRGNPLYDRWDKFTFFYDIIRM